MSLKEPAQALNLDSSQQQSFVRFFNAMPEKPSTTIRIFNRSDYYTLHGADALFAAQEVFKSTNECKIMGSEPKKLEYVVLGRKVFEKFVRDLLLVKQYRVEVYFNQGTVRNNDWKLEYKGSPGNLSQFEDVIFDNVDLVTDSVVMAVKLGKNHLVGVACVDANEKQMQACEFVDDDYFSELEALLVQMGPKECIVQQGAAEEFANMKTVLERSGVNCCTAKKSDFNTGELAGDLNRLLHFEEGQQKNSAGLPAMKMDCAMAGLQAAIKYLELKGDRNHFNSYKLSILDSKRFVHLDNAAVAALNVLPRPGTGQGVRHESVLGLLDRCKTPQGRRLLAQWVKQPLRDINAISERLDIVELLVNDPELRQNVHDHLRSVPDILLLSRKLAKKNAGLLDCYKVYQLVQRLPNLIKCLRTPGHKTMRAAFVEPLDDLALDMDKFQQMIEQTLDLDQVDRGEYLVKPSFDEELAELHQQKQDLEEKINIEFRKAAKDLNLQPTKAIKLETNDQHGYFFRITLKEETALRKKGKEYSILDAIKGGVRFTTERLKDLNETYSGYKEKYEEQQKSVVSEIMSIAVGYRSTLNSINTYLAKLDVLMSFALTATSGQKQYIRPKLLPEESGVLRLKQVRHPCIEIQKQGTFIPNDISFKQGEETFHIITGPNMGGKSTYIRSVGLTVLLAHVGCFVPCDEAEISLVDCILARVGADDCQLKGLSTFMLEMVETAGILRMATDKSVVIIDELGRGTSTYEGCGIAWAIAEHLAKEIKCFSMFATHFHEITQLADDVPTVTNKHVTAEAINDTLVLLYEVRPGVCDQSFGIHVAKMAKFPPEVIEDAIAVQNSLEDYQRLTVLNNADPATKKKAYKEGEQLIEEFLKTYEKLKEEISDEAELKAKLVEMRKEIEGKGNPYIQALLEGI